MALALYSFRSSHIARSGLSRLIQANQPLSIGSHIQSQVEAFEEPEFDFVDLDELAFLSIDLATYLRTESLDSTHHKEQVVVVNPYPTTSIQMELREQGNGPQEHMSGKLGLSRDRTGETTKQM